MLRLRIVSDQRRTLADRSSVIFSAEGGTIGRSADNDWVLPDPLRYVSAHHARVQFRGGHFYLQDVSTNGVFINDDMEPLAKRGSGGYRLANGDVIRMGEYHIVAALEARRGKEETGASAVPTSIHTLRALGGAADHDIGAALNLDDLLQPPSDTGSGLPVNAYGQSVDSGRVRALARQPAAAAPAAPEPPTLEPAAPEPTAPEPGEPDAALIAERMARLAEALGRDTNGSAAADDVQSGLEAFCRGAGVAAERLPADAQPRLLHLAGRLLREALLGFKDLDRTRADMRNRYRIEVPAAEQDDPRPVLGSSMVEELLIALLAQHEARALDAVQWLREMVADAKQHETAAAQATRAAFVEFLDRLDPAELEARFERAARRGKARAADKAQYWELFTSFYRNLIEMPPDHLPHTFIEAFASAYREALRKPAS